MNMQPGPGELSATAFTETLDPAALADSYPSRPHRFAHRLADHPLMGIDAIAHAALRHDPSLLECRVLDSRNGRGFAFGSMHRGCPAATIRAIGEAGRWVMLRQVERLPGYAALVEDVLEGLRPVIQPATGAPVTPHAFLFVSAPGTLTPFHFDPEFNVLYQISGRKDFAVYPPRAPWLTDRANETYHATGDNLLAWQTGYERQGRVERLAPGDALYVPYRAPHWVRVGDEPSVSLSITWRCAASYDQDDAFRFNRWLRGFGVSPTPPAPVPGRSRAKATAWRALSRFGIDG